MGQSDSLPSKLNMGEKDELEARGYRSHRWKWALTLALIVLTFGLFGVILVWRKDIKMALFFQECPLHEATVILLKDSFGQFYQETIHRQESKDSNAKSLSYSHYFHNKKIKYVWDAGILQFVKFRAFDIGMTCDVFHDRIDGGLEPQGISEMGHLYGGNVIEIIVPPIYKMILKEVSNPFYMFQLYTVIVWMAQRYYNSCAMVVTGTVLAVGSSVYEARKQMKSLRKKTYVTGTVKVVRGGVEKSIPASELVPGDLICIKPEEPQLLHCDAVIVEGSCSVDESMLTGESYPITKIAIPKDPMTNFSYQEHKRHILFCGTQLLQGRCEGNNIYLKAVVIRTGYMSGKGELIRAILHPKPIHFRFYQDLVKVVCLFFAIGFGGMIYSVYTWIRNGAYLHEIILNSLDIVTFVVPPHLPAGLTVCTLFAQKRLKNKKIFCLNSKHISLSGGVDVICFDKTGTLTESDIDLAAAIPIQEGELRHPVAEMETLPESHPLLTVMSTCHSLIRLKENLSGYSIDRKMFEATGWTFKEGPPGVNAEYGVETPFLVSSPLWNRDRESTYNPTTELAILKRFPFESNMKRMTVIVRRKNHERFQVVVKGAPETIARICDPVTVPSNYDAVLKHYTIQGYRVLALAMKDLSPHLTWTQVRKCSREELESHVELVGLLIVQNQLKKETLPTINLLHDAHINTVMVTGDNLQTAITVAKDCQMIDRTQKIIQVEAFLVPASIYGAQHLKVVYKDPMAAPEFFSGTVKKLRDVHSSNFCLTLDGSTFEALRIHNLPLLEKVVARAKVFARMAPEDKQRLIEILQRLGRQVAMVGDGCNDCGALRTADAGISLSMADASVAAPFTSQDTNISCIVPLIREGRNTLDCAFGAFQFATSNCFISFIAVLMLYSISSEPSDFQFFIWDFGIVNIPFFTIGNFLPAERLHPRRPLRHLWAFLPLFSFFTFLAWQTMVLLIGWFYCHAQTWFTPNVFEPGRFPPNPCYEETTIYFLSCIGAIVAAFVFAPSPPYCRSILSNKIFCLWGVFAVTLVTCIMFITEPRFVDWMNLKTPPEIEFTVVIYFLGVGAGVLCYIWQKFFLREWLYLEMIPLINKYRRPRHAYQKIEKGLRSEPDWPNMEDEELRDYHPIETNDPCTLNHLSDNPSALQASNTPRSPSALAIAVEEAESDEDREIPPPPDGFQSAESDIEDSAEPDRITPSVIKIDIDPSADGSAEEHVQLLAYRMAPNPADLSPSRQRRHLNRNAPSQ